MRIRGKQALSGLALAIAVPVIPLIPCLACLTARAPVPPDCGRTSCHAVLSPSRQPGSISAAGRRRDPSNGTRCIRPGLPVGPAMLVGDEPGRGRVPKVPGTGGRGPGACPIP